MSDDLFRRPLLPQQGQDRLPQRGSAGEQALLRAPGEVKCPFLRSDRPVDVASAVVVDFNLKASDAYSRAKDGGEGGLRWCRPANPRLRDARRARVGSIPG